MEFMVKIDLKKPSTQIGYSDKIFLAGSCFTEHIGNALSSLKFSVLQNPNGILFDPNSICESLHSYIEHKQYKPSDFFQLNELWHSWKYHSRFSNTDPEEATKKVNESQDEAHDFLEKASWMIITFGSAFSYRLNRQAALPKNIEPGTGVANCHRAPAQWFQKHLMSVEEIVSSCTQAFTEANQFNPGLKFIFTVSPVRHIRDGVVENNRSKARLIESVHQLLALFPNSYYFPAYELVIDVLRDYRFYDTDLAHPNYMATEFVLEKFIQTFVDEPSQKIMEEVREIVIARKHRAFQPATNAHRLFLKSNFEKIKLLQQQHTFLDLNEELEYFSKGAG